MKAKLEVEGFEAEQILEQVASTIVCQHGEKIERRIHEKIDVAINDAIEASVGECVSEQVKKILEAGFGRTDSWGNSVGEKVTLAKRIEEELSRRDSYDRTSLFEKICREEIDKALRADIGKELARAKEEMRKQVDSVLQAKLKDTISSALGLK